MTLIVSNGFILPQPNENSLFYLHMLQFTVNFYSDDEAFLILALLTCVLKLVFFSNSFSFCHLIVICSMAKPK